MIEAVSAAQQASHSVDVRLPMTFSYRIGGIVGRAMLGFGALAAAAGAFSQPELLWSVIGIGFALFGCVVVGGNLLALVDPGRRTITLTGEGLEIRYGVSRRFYRFADYAEFRIAKVGLRRFLTALALEGGSSPGDGARGKRISVRLKPAVISPMPPLGDGAPASLREWQAMLNALRQTAVIAAQREGKVRLVPNTATGDARR